MNSRDQIIGLVLAGGKSERMGRDKGLIPYHGIPHREYVFHLLSEFCGQVFTSCAPGQTMSSSFHPLTDLYDIRGPLNGILTAFQQHPGKALLAVAVDMPYVTAETIQMLITKRDPQKVATCFFNREEGFPEPLLTVWEPVAGALLSAWHAAGNVSPRKFLAQNNIQVVAPPDDRILLSINSPDQLARYFPEISG